jgi:Tol biopolymer transport system component
LSPDGDLIAWYAVAYGHSFIGVVNSTSGEMRVVVNDGSQPSWSPDENKIAYSGGGIMVVNVDGTNATRISDEGTTPDWSPTGRKLCTKDGIVSMS